MKKKFFLARVHVSLIIIFFNIFKYFIAYRIEIDYTYEMYILRSCLHRTFYFLMFEEFFRGDDDRTKNP